MEVKYNRQSGKVVIKLDINEARQFVSSDIARDVVAQKIAELRDYLEGYRIVSGLKAR